MSGQEEGDPQVVTECCPKGIEKLEEKKKSDRDTKKITERAG